MTCDVCSRAFTPKRLPLCPACAQVTLYESRFAQIQALCEREEAHIHAEAIVRPGNDGVLAALPPAADLEAITVGIQQHGWKAQRTELQSLETGVESARDRAEQLRDEIEACRKYAAEQQEDHTQRRHNLSIERRQLAERRASAIETVLGEARKAERKLQKVHTRTAQARAALCRAVAHLSGLRRSKAPDGSSAYTLGGSQIFDLKHLNGNPVNDMSETMRLDKASGDPKQHEIINASLGNVCHLLVQCCHYLYIRLPAEIVLPHNYRPTAMILPERASYRNVDLSDVAQPHRSSSPAASAVLDRSNTSRPRPLTIERALPQLAKDDSKSFNMFIEGVALLAWDVAWLCKTQGVEPVSDFNDISCIGRNLYNLFVAKDTAVRPSLDRNLSSATNTSRAKSTTYGPSLQLGVFSHGSVRNSLAGPDIAALLRNWKYASPTRLADRLKTHLLNDLSHREWDEVNENEWKDEAYDEPAVLVGGTRKTSVKPGLVTSIMTINEMDGARDGKFGATAAKEGWMRVRARDGEV